MFGIDKLVSAAANALSPDSIKDLALGPAGSALFDVIQKFTQDGAEGEDGRRVVTRDHRSRASERTVVGGYDLEDIDDVKDLMRAAALGDKEAKKILSENSGLIDLTVSSFANGQRAFSNLSQALFDVDKALIGNIRV